MQVDLARQFQNRESGRRDFLNRHAAYLNAQEFCEKNRFGLIRKNLNNVVSSQDCGRFAAATCLERRGKNYHEIRNYRCRGSSRDRSSWIGRLRQQAEAGTCSEQNRNIQIRTIIKAGWNAVPPGLLLFDWQMNQRRNPKPQQRGLNQRRTKNEI
jgi:hypothetical protein